MKLSRSGTGKASDHMYKRNQGLEDRQQMPLYTADYAADSFAEQSYLPSQQASQPQPQIYDPSLQHAGPGAPYYGVGPGYGGGMPLMGHGDAAADPNLYMGNFMNDQMANVAMAYGQSLMGQGKQIVDQKLEKYVPISKLKYYFAVDTTYVRRKLMLVMFPFANSDWSIKYNQDEPVAPRYEANAPDLYIPVMAFVTFILIAGFALGTQNKFSPEQLGIQASSAFGWLVLEVIVLLITNYIMNIQTDLTYLDFVAFSSYKYVGMVLIVASGLIFYSFGYYITLLYFSAALAYFLVKTLRIQIIPKSSSGEHHIHGNKRRMYLLLCIAFFQPIIMFWLTRHLVPVTSTQQAAFASDSRN